MTELLLKTSEKSNEKVCGKGCIPTWRDVFRADDPNIPYRVTSNNSTGYLYILSLPYKVITYDIRLWPPIVTK